MRSANRESTGIRLIGRYRARHSTRISALVAFILASFLLPTHAADAISVPQANSTFHVERVAEGLGLPWGMAFLNPNELIFTERQGRVKVLDLTSLEVTSLRGAPEVVANGQGGLFDVAVGPNYASEGWLYFTYSKHSNAGAVTTLARARRDGNRLSGWQDLLITRSATSSSRHFGGRIAFDDSGYLYFGIGDRGERDRAQDLSNHAGAILRLGLDGSLPADNPFLDQPKHLDEIWSYGHRNPQGLLFDNESGQLWSIEHGPRGGDEINLVIGARNYGWPVISHGKEYWGPVGIGEGSHKAGMEQPVKVYIPSIAPGSLLLYRGSAFPQWQGDLFAGALKLRHLNRVSLSESSQAVAEERLLGDLGERIRALVESPEGWIYFSTDSGKILRIRPRK